MGVCESGNMCAFDELVLMRERTAVTFAIWSWAFEARSIQDYLFETGRLADAVGASLLVDRLTGDLASQGEDAAPTDLLSCVLKAEGLDGRLQFSRRAGGAFVAFSHERSDLVRARLAWHAALYANAPGLRWSDGLAGDSSPKSAAAAALRQAQVRGQFDLPQLPEATPTQLRVARSGQPAQRMERLGAEGVVPVDGATWARRRHRLMGGRRLTARFAPDPELRWPTDLDPSPELAGDDTAFPFNGSNRDVAFVHADGNGLGALLRRLAAEVRDEDYVETYANFSHAISRATQAAAVHATREVLLPACNGRRVPARPLILGGDDLQIIVRADLALPFVQVFLREFERESAQHLQGLRKQLNLGAGEGLTAAAGVLVAKASFPFAVAASRAGQLCDMAKKAIKREARALGRAMPVSALGLERAQGAADSADDDGVRSFQPRLQAYAVTSERTRLPRLDDLQDLAQALGAAGAPRGPARRLLTDLYVDWALARERYRRMREMQGESAWRRIDAALQALGVPAGADLPMDAEHATPWADALLVRDLLEPPAAPTTDAQPRIPREIA